jgi:cell wall-associated NlpC family hydrolase
MTDWRTALLHNLGYKPTGPNLRFLETWQRWEGGHTNNSARFNWLNTTHGPGTSINSVGVKRFNSFNQGIQSLAETLQNGRYGDILDGLASGNPYAGNVGAGLQVWVSGRPDGNPGYAAKILGGHVAAPVHARAAAAVQGFKSKWPTSVGDPKWNFAMMQIFDDDPELAHMLAAMDDKIARQVGAVSPGGSLQPLELGGFSGNQARVAKIAGSQIGKPYVFGSGPSTESFDCSDLIQWTYKQIGISLPRTTYDQIKVGRAVSWKQLQPGDLIFPTGHHVVMYVGHGKVIAAPHTGTFVQYQDVNQFKNPVAIRRVMP